MTKNQKMIPREKLKNRLMRKANPGHHGNLFFSYYVHNLDLTQGLRQCGWICTRVIHSYIVNDKLDILLLFQPNSESFGKWCLEKCKNFFDTTTLMPAKSVPKFYYITHLCELEQNRKLIFSSFFKNKIEFCCLNTSST